MTVYKIFEYIYIFFIYVIFTEIRDSYGKLFVMLFMTNPPNHETVTLLISTPQDSDVEVEVFTPNLPNLISQMVTVR